MRAILLFSLLSVAAAEPDLWNLARQHRGDHVFSTLFEAPTVTKQLSTDSDIGQAIDWCKRTAITKVYIESFRNGHKVARDVLVRARDRFRAAGFDVSGGVTTLGHGRRSTGWKLITCFSDTVSQESVKSVFEYTAGLFDEIMIDDFWFTDCTCEECDRFRRDRKVTIGGRTTAPAGDAFEDYRRELMLRLSREYVIAASKAVNPKAKLIIKYTQWYDRFHERGYHVREQSADFDTIWVGTESRDRAKTGKVQYEGYFIMRWLAGIGGPKTGGGWFDPYTTSEPNYIEQARQTILAGAKETVLFCYGALTRGEGAKDIAALRPHFKELFTVAREVRRRPIVGIAAYKPPDSPAEKEAFVYDFIGMMGLPLVPCHEFPANAPAAFFPVHAMKDKQFPARLEKFISAGRPALVTDGLAELLAGKVNLERPNVRILKVAGNPTSLLDLKQEELDLMRIPLLKPLKTTFRAPNQVSLYLFRDGSWAIENFNDTEAEIELNGKRAKIAARGWTYTWK